MRRAVILAHGAGNDMEHPFMNHFHAAFAEAGALSVKFNFPFKEYGRKSPDRLALLEDTLRAVIGAVMDDPKLAPKQLFLAGKSLGGRVASHLAAAASICQGLVVLGYPLHPPSKPGILRVDHWARLGCPVLFVEGTRDPLCDLALLRTQLPRISSPVTLQLVEGGDHSFKLPTAAGKAQEEVWSEASAAVVAWMAETAGKL